MDFLGIATSKKIIQGTFCSQSETDDCEEDEIPRISRDEQDKTLSVPILMVLHGFTSVSTVIVQIS